MPPPYDFEPDFVAWINNLASFFATIDSFCLRLDALEAKMDTLIPPPPQ